jgi:hypothetical protein
MSKFNIVVVKFLHGLAQLRMTLAIVRKPLFDDIHLGAIGPGRRLKHTFFSSICIAASFIFYLR